MTTAPSLADRIRSVISAFESARIPYAVGGALALAYHAEPRATADIDVNVFVRTEHSDQVFTCLEPLGVRVEQRDREAARSREQVRLDFAGIFLDLFFGGLPFHESCQRRSRTVPFDGTMMRILSAEDLAVFKALFNRPKDWEDIVQILEAQGPKFDGSYALGWLDELAGPADTARRRFAALLAGRE